MVLLWNDSSVKRTYHAYSYIESVCGLTYLWSFNKKVKFSGLAPVTGMCTASSSCTVNEGRHFESVYVVTHEIGHK